MTYEEFIERTGKELSTDDEWRQVMRKYNRSSLEKDDFCREWLENSVAQSDSPKIGVGDNG